MWPEPTTTASITPSGYWPVEGQPAAQDREGSSVPAEGEVAQYVREAEPAVQPPGSVVLLGYFGCGQHHVGRRDAAQQSAAQSSTETVPLGARENVQLGQLEVVRERGFDGLRGMPRAPQSVANLLMPPLVRGTVVAVRDGHQRIGLCRIGVREQCADGSPARAVQVFTPHWGSALFGSTRIAHGLDVDGQCLEQPLAEFRGRQIDQVRRCPRIGDDCSQPFFGNLSVGTAILNVSNGCSTIGAECAGGFGSYVESDSSGVRL